jgi:hypothetical protein
MMRLVNWQVSDRGLVEDGIVKVPKKRIRYVVCMHVELRINLTFGQTTSSSEDKAEAKEKKQPQESLLDMIGSYHSAESGGKAPETGSAQIFRAKKDSSTKKK